MERSKKLDVMEQQLKSLKAALEKEQGDKEQLLVRVEQMVNDNHKILQFHQQLDA
jgi:hypothetical protein